MRELWQLRGASTIAVLVLLIISISGVIRAQGKEELGLRTHALKINVADMRKAVSFYVDKLGFEVADRSEYPRQVVLKTGERLKLILNRVERVQNLGPLDAHVGLTLQVNDLNQAMARMKANGVEFAEASVRKEGVGNAISIRDPFGGRISLMHQTIVKVEPFKEPRIYNFGVLVPDMSIAREFYAHKLGFIVRSERYLPGDLPLGHRDNTFAFMLHFRESVEAKKRDEGSAFAYTMVFETDDLERTIRVMAGEGIKTIRKAAKGGGGNTVASFADPFGIAFEVVEIRAKLDSSNH